MTSKLKSQALPRRAGVMIGIGLGGFVDGILFHQILGWHNMGSAVLPPNTMDAMRQNMIWDGLFHAAVWVMTLVGVFTLLADVRRHARVPTVRSFIGQLMLGWGSFNLVEGIIDHELLNLHHVRDLPVHVPVYDWMFLLIGGVAFIAAGIALSREQTVTSR